MRKTTMALTGALAVIGLAVTAAPASAEPAASDDVGIMAQIGTAHALQLFQGDFADIQSGQAACTALVSTVTGLPLTARSARHTSTTSTFTLYQDATCNSPVVTLSAGQTDNGVGTALGTNGAVAYTST